MRDGAVAWRASAIAVATAALLGVYAPAALASAEHIDVTQLADQSFSENAEACENPATEGVPTPNSEKCSIREALEEASKITFTTASSIEIDVPAGEYKISKGTLRLGNRLTNSCEGTHICSVTLDGAGAGATIIDGQKAATVLQTIIESEPLTVQGLTIRHGHGEYGGGVYDEFGVHLVLRSVVLSENEVTKDGAGLYAVGPATLVDSWVTGNRASNEGGGIYAVNFGATAVRTSITGNKASIVGGGMMTAHANGGVYDSTVAGNEAPGGGGLGVEAGDLTVQYSTVADNTSFGGAIEGVEKNLVTLEGSIVSGNTDPQCERVETLKTVGANIISGEDLCAATGPAPSSAAPLLSGLVPMGIGQGIELLAGSPAVNAGGATCAGAATDDLGPVDERGVSRPQGAGCDLGAFEAGSDASVALTATPDPVPLAGTLALTATVSDAGAEAATGTAVTVPLPAHTSFVSAPSGCTLVTGPPAVVTCSIGTLEPGHSVQKVIDVRPEASGALLETATVTHTEADSNPANNSVTIASVVAGSTTGGPGTGGSGPGGPGTGGTPKGTATAKLIGSSFTVDSHGNVLVRVRCAGGSKGGCVTALDLFASSGVLPAAASAVRKGVLYARAHVTIAAGKTAFVHLHLSKAALKQLKKSHLLRVRALLSVHGTVAALTTSRYSLALKPAKRRRH